MATCIGSRNATEKLMIYNNNNTTIAAEFDCQLMVTQPNSFQLE